MSSTRHRKIAIRIVKSNQRSSTFAPLEKVNIHIKLPSLIGSILIEISDICGKIYFEKEVDKVDKNLKFSILGPLGTHRMRVYDKDNGNLIWQQDITVDTETKIETGNKFYDSFYPRLKSIIANDLFSLFVDNEQITALEVIKDNEATSIRDHTHSIKAFKYWLKDIKSLPTHFLTHQRENGSVYDFLGNIDGDIARFHFDCIDKDYRYANKKEKVYYSFLPKEADISYHIVNLVYVAWQCTGDDLWMKNRLNGLEAAMNYMMNDKWRWSKKHNLVKRPFTLDTWDATYMEDSEGEVISFIDEKDKWMEMLKVCLGSINANDKFCIMHGDNSGMYMACNLLSKMFAQIGNKKRGRLWRKKAVDFKKNTNKICWNGKFYTHQIFLEPVIFKFKEDKELEHERLSLSNTYDINRGLTDHMQAVSIIKEYQKRRELTKDKCFCEWFSIHPPYRSFANIKTGRYFNGGVSSLVGGELAKGAFDHGYEEYGLDILKRYNCLIKEEGNDHIFWDINADGKRMPCDIGPRAWAISAMIYAYIEGLAGVEDMDKLFKKVRLSPRWIITGNKKAEVTVRYGASNGYFAYLYEHQDVKRIVRLITTGSGSSIDFHLLLPQRRKADRVVIDGRTIKFINETVEQSNYVNFSIDTINNFNVEVRYR